MPAAVGVPLIVIVLDAQVAVTPAGDAGFRAVAAGAGLTLQPIGRLVAQQTQAVVIR